jgi:hypothetical protein
MTHLHRAATLCVQFGDEHSPSGSAWHGHAGRRDNVTTQFTYREFLLDTIGRSFYVDKPAYIMGWQSTGIVNSHVP